MRDMTTLGDTTSPSATRAKPPFAVARGVRLALCLLAVGMIAWSAPARASDDEDDATEGMSFEQRMLHQLMTGAGAINGASNKGIDYRERSPLVIPPSTNLTTPGATAEAPTANWPKDPDVKRRKDAAANRSQKTSSAEEQARVLMPSELNANRGTRSIKREDITPGQRRDESRPLMPEELGVKSGLLGSILNYKKEESAVFTGEPSRESLTQPPPGYQTPAPNYAYGSNAVGGPLRQETDENKPLAPGKF